MKNLLLSTLLALIIGSAFATGESKISYFVLNNFKNDFKNATNVTWTTKAELSKAAFTENSRKVEAFYGASGKLVAVSKTIDLNELPVEAKRVFAKKYEGYTVKEAVKYEGTFHDKYELSYYLSAENDKESVIIKVDQNEQLSVYKKQKK